MNHRYDFHFDYQVTSVGVPQPFPVGFSGQEIVIRLMERDVVQENGVEVEPVLNICGNREGLKYLAALCLLAADSEQYDDSFHIHLENSANIDTNIGTTIRAPAYLEPIRSGQFEESYGKPIELPQDENTE